MRGGDLLFGPQGLLRFAHRQLPVLPDVVVKDSLAKLHPLRAAFLRNVAVGGRRFEQSQLRAKERVLISLRGARPESIRRIADHLMRQGVERFLPALELPIRWWSE